MESCPAQLTERVISLASRKAFDIEHLGEQSAIALTNPEENRPDSVATYAPNITEVLVAPGEEPDPYEPVEGLELPAAQKPVLSNESGLFNLTAADLRDVRVWREAAIVEVHETVGANGKKKKVRKRVGGSGLWHQVPAFWTAPTPAKKLTAKQLAERAQGETAIESAETQGGTASETTGAPTGLRRHLVLCRALPQPPILSMACRPTRLSCAWITRPRALASRMYR